MTTPGFWNGAPPVAPPTPPKKRRGWKIAGVIAGVLLLFGLIGSLDDDDKTSSVATTVTQTVTQTPQAFVQAPTATATVTVTAQAAPAPTVTITEAASAPDTVASVPAPVVQIPVPAQESSVYYSSCSDARAAGAAPLFAGSAGYRTGLDRDGDGVACES